MKVSGVSVEFSVPFPLGMPIDGRQFTKEALEKALPSFKNIPIEFENTPIGVVRDANIVALPRDESGEICGGVCLIRCKGILWARLSPELSVHTEGDGDDFAAQSISISKD